LKNQVSQNYPEQKIENETETRRHINTSTSYSRWYLFAVVIPLAENKPKQQILLFTFLVATLSFQLVCGMMMNVSESHMSNQSKESKKCLCQFVETHQNTAPSSCLGDPTCPACVQRALRPHVERNDQAMKDHTRARKACAQQLEQSQLSHLSELQSESQRLRDRLGQIRKDCAEMAVRVASQAVENDERQESMNSGVDQHRNHMARLENSLMHGAMSSAIDVSTNQVRVLRFQWARKALTMHRLDVVDPDDATAPTRQQRRARGIGKIG
jgi:hypothetical protein